MFSNSQHLTAFIKECRADEDALPFLVGYLLRDLNETRICDALNALARHRLELTALEQDDAKLRLADLLDPRD